MDNKLSDDPRSIRARAALRNALKELLGTKPYQKITVTDIARKAELARHTFYNHYETKDDLLNGVIDSTLEDFFSNLMKLDLKCNDPEEIDRQFGPKFFQIWLDNPDIVKILNTVDIDRLLIERVILFYTKFYYDCTIQTTMGASEGLARYVSTYNAYVLVGVLRQWLKEGMKYPPELMGQFINHFAGIKLKKAAIEKFKDSIK